MQFLSWIWIHFWICIGWDPNPHPNPIQKVPNFDEPRTSAPSLLYHRRGLFVGIEIKQGTCAAARGFANELAQGDSKF